MLRGIEGNAKDITLASVIKEAVWKTISQTGCNNPLRLLMYADITGWCMLNVILL